MNLPELRKFARLFLDYAGGGLEGRDENDPIYQEITEHRDMGLARKSYSSCCDLAHWLYFRLGVRSPWVNRAEHHGWKMGANVSLLASHPAKRIPRASDTFDAGDVLIIWSHPDGTDAHVICIREQQGQTLLTAEYGQPGGLLRTREMRPLEDGGFAFGARTAHVWLPLQRVLAIAEQAGELVAPDMALIGSLEAYPA